MTGAGRRVVRLVAAVAAVAATVVIGHGQVLETMRVSSDSMRPTLRSGDAVVVDKLTVRTGPVRRGDLVAFSSPQDGAVVLKRVVGVGGDTVEIRDAVLFVDDRAVHEPYVDAAAFDATYFGPVTVPAGQVFVLGDNRAASIDSRTYGGVPLARMVGRVLKAATLPGQPATGGTPPA